MEHIRFFVAKETTEYESQGYMYKSADANFADTYCQTGGGYVRKLRWVECQPEEATHFEWSAPAASTTRTIDDPLHRYPLSCVEEITEELRQWFQSVPTGRLNRRSICYSTITKNALDSAPGFLKGAILAFEMEAHRTHSGHVEYLQEFHPVEVLHALQQAGVQPVYLEESTHLPDLRPKLFERVEDVEGRVGYKFFVPRGEHGATHPKNLDKLPVEISVEIGAYNRLVDQIEAVTFFGPITEENAWKLHRQGMEHDHSLSNSDRRIAGEDILMCSTLKLVYETLADGMFDALRAAKKVKGVTPEEYLAQVPAPDIRVGR